MGDHRMCWCLMHEAVRLHGRGHALCWGMQMQYTLLIRVSSLCWAQEKGWQKGRKDYIKEGVHASFGVCLLSWNDGARCKGAGRPMMNATPLCRAELDSNFYPPLHSLKFTLAHTWVQDQMKLLLISHRPSSKFSAHLRSDLDAIVLG